MICYMCTLHAILHFLNIEVCWVKKAMKAEREREAVKEFQSVKRILRTTLSLCCIVTVCTLYLHARSYVVSSNDFW